MNVTFMLPVASGLGNMTSQIKDISVESVTKRRWERKEKIEGSKETIFWSKY